MTRVLVTGAGGFIGSHLVEHLVEQDFEVRALVHYNARGSSQWLEHVKPSVIEGVEVMPGDVRDSHCVRQAMAGCQIVFHLAALIGIPYSYRSPESYVDTNVKGTLNVVQAAHDFGVDRIIQTSTSEVYGTATSFPICEDHPLQGQSPYSASKIGADQIALSFHASFATPVTVVRPFNTYGPRQSARAVIPTVITQIHKGRDRIRLGALHPTRDFSFVNDIVRAFLAAARSEMAVGQVINVGSGFEISIGDTAALIAEIMGTKIEIEQETQRLRPEKSEVERLYCDNSRAAKLLKWRPNYGGRDGFRKGLEQTIEWFSDPANQAYYKPDTYGV